LKTGGPEDMAGKKGKGGRELVLRKGRERRESSRSQSEILRGVLGQKAQRRGGEKILSLRFT